MLRKLTDFLHITSPAQNRASVLLQDVKTEMPGAHQRSKSEVKVVPINPLLADRDLAGENLTLKQRMKSGFVKLSNLSLTTLMILPSAVFSAAYATSKKTSEMVWPYVRDLRGWELALTIRNFITSMAINYSVATDYFGNIEKFRKKKLNRNITAFVASAAIIAFIVAYTGYSPVINSLFSIQFLTGTVVILLGGGAAFFAYVSRYGNIEEAYNKFLNSANREDVVFSHNVADLLQYRINKDLTPQIKKIFEKASVRYGLKNIKVRKFKNTISIDDDRLKIAKDIFVAVDYDVDLLSVEQIEQLPPWIYRAALNAKESYLAGEVNNDIVKDALARIDRLIASQPPLDEPAIRDLNAREIQFKKYIRTLQWVLAISFLVTANPVFAETVAGTILPVWLGNLARTVLGNLLATSTGLSYANVGWEVPQQSIDAWRAHALTQGMSWHASAEALQTTLLAICAAYSGAGMAGLAHDKFYNNSARIQQYISLDESAPLYSQIWGALTVLGIGAGAASFNWKSVVGKFNGQPGPDAASILLKRKHAGNEPLRLADLEEKIPHLAPYLRAARPNINRPSPLRRFGLNALEQEPLNPAGQRDRDYGAAGSPRNRQ